MNAGGDYPQRVPLKVVGANGKALREALAAALAHNLGDAALAEVSERESTRGSYVALTASFVAESREQLVAIYTELRGHEAVHLLL